MIREATQADVSALVAMGRQFRQSTDYADLLSDNPVQFQAMAERLIDGPDSVVFVEDQGDGPIGMIGLLIYPHHLSGETMAGEVFWWVNPEARGAGIRLLVKAERWAANHGAEKIQMIAPNARVGQLYERRGYQLIELAYQKNVA